MIELWVSAVASELLMELAKVGDEMLALETVPGDTIELWTEEAEL